MQYFLNPKVAVESVPSQLEQIAEEILIPLLVLFHNLVEKVAIFIDISSAFLLYMYELGSELTHP